MSGLPPIPSSISPNATRGLLPRGLLTLILLRYRATLRRYLFGSGKQRVMTIVGLGFVAVWILPQLLIRPPNVVASDTLRQWVPVGILVMLGVSLLTAKARQGAGFSPQEVDLVFPGPFLRRQIALYQIVYQIGPLLFMGLWMAIFLRVGENFLNRAIAFVLIGQGINLLAACSVLLIGVLRARGGTLASIVPAVIVVMLATAAVWSAPPLPLGGDFASWRLWATQLRETAIVSALCLPFVPYVEVLVGSFAGETLGWLAAAVGLNALLMSAYVALDRGEIESMVQMVKKRHRRHSPDEGISVPRSATLAQRTVPMLPWLGGAGPTMWRQLTIQFRRFGVLGSLLAPVLLAILGAVIVKTLGTMGGVFAGMLCFYTYLGMSVILKCDFRGDLDHMPHLRTLPVSAQAIAAAQIASSAIVMSAVVLPLALGILFGASALTAEALFAAMVGVVPLCAAIVSIDNAAFLLVPVRINTSTMNAGFDPALMARTMLLFLLKLLGLGALAAVIGTMIWVGGVLDLPLWFVAPVSAAVVAGVDWAMVGACAVLFNRFNITADQPG